MKMIVTGSEGFVGKALCHKLKKSGVDLVEIDRKIGIDASSVSEY